ncbi:PPC domain-containing DNA-binding protein [Tranquillimonas rosea]|uniref:PPC domain-containing DNA-binding protein n=1 Tax=Tranquillimonas rosea TaxID=641238 RepID=UPI003BAD2693
MQRTHWPATHTRHVALRLTPGADLRGALDDAFRRSGASAGFIVAQVGSLTHARLRPAGRDDAVEIPGPLEIVSLSGTFSPDGPHLHLAVSDAGCAVYGGHLLTGCPVRTTAELILGVTDAARFSRERDVETGYAELVIRPA